MVKSRGSRLSAAARREQLLAHALPVFARTGYAAASTRQLASAAGVTEPILYRHFRGKEALFAAVLGLAAARIGASLRALPAGLGGLRSQLEALAAALPELLDRHAAEFRVLGAAAAAPANRQQAVALQKAFAQLEQAVAARLAGPVERGEAGWRGGVDASLAATFLLQVGFGHVLLRTAGSASLSRDDLRARMVDLLAAALLSAPRVGAGTARGER
jgi:AcrR family transcriptional regulator